MPDDVFYVGDVVELKEKPGIGVIIDVPDSDSDEDTDDEALAKDTAMVSWYPTGEEELSYQTKLKVVSRTLDPGMGVSRQGDAKQGVLIDVRAVCSIQPVGTDTVINNIPGTQLTSWNLHHNESHVVLGAWVGFIQQIQQTLIVGLKNGARVLMKWDTARHMEDSKYSETSPYFSGTWYVGQKLEGKARWFKRASLISGTMPAYKPKAKVKAVVLEAVLTGLEVDWMMHGYHRSESNPVPDTLITGDQLNKIIVFDRFQQRYLTVGLPALWKDLTEQDYKVKQSDSLLEKLLKEDDNSVLCNTTQDSALCNTTQDSVLSASVLDGLIEDDEGEQEEIADQAEEPVIEETRPSEQNTDNSTTEEVNKADKKPKEGEDAVNEEEKEVKREGEEDESDDDNSDSLSDTDSGLDQSQESPMLDQSQSTPNVTRTKVLRKRRPSKNNAWIHKMTPQGPIKINGEYLIEIVAASYTGKVLWEDGVIEEVPCTQLTQIQHLDESAHMPGYFVCKVDKPDDIAVVRTYNAKDRTCSVYWLNTLEPEDDVSVYSLETSNKYDFNPMDIVVCFEECTHSPTGQVLYVTDTGQLKVYWSDKTIHNVDINNIVLAYGETEYDELSVDDDTWSEGWITAGSDSEGTHGGGWTRRGIVRRNGLLRRIVVTVKRTRNRLSSRELETGDTPLVDGLVPGTEQSETVSVQERKLALQERVLGFLTNEEEIRLAEEEDRVIHQETERERREFQACGPDQGQDQRGEKEEVGEGASARGDSAAERQSSSDSTNLGSLFVNNQAVVSPIRKRFRNGRTMANQPLGPPEPTPSNCEVNEVIKEHSNIMSESFKMLEKSPSKHHYQANSVSEYQRSFLNSVRKDIKLISSSLPAGIWVRAFEERMDLLSCLIEGPANTPYEGALFAFDIHLPSLYSAVPPHLHYVSYSSTKLNPNLYPDGKVCLSLLGTWMGKGTEQWTKCSNLLQLLVSIQSLVLNTAPYFNEAGFNKFRDTAGGENNSRLYNEMVMLKLLEHSVMMIANPPEAFSEEVRLYFREHGLGLLERYDHFIKLSEEGSSPDIGYQLLPLSKGVIACIRAEMLKLKIALSIEAVF